MLINAAELLTREDEDTKEDKEQYESLQQTGQTPGPSEPSKLIKAVTHSRTRMTDFCTANTADQTKAGAQKKEAALSQSIKQSMGQ